MNMKELELKFARFMFARDHAGRRKLWRKIAKLLSNGVQILKAIEDVHRRRVAAGKKSDPTTIALKQWAIAIQSGKRFSEAIRPWVSPEEVMIVGAGEASGRIEHAMQSACEYMVAKKAIRSAVVGGVLYPLILFAMAVGVLVMFSYTIIPAFMQAAPKAQWTGLAAHMVSIAGWTQQWIVPCLSLALLSLIGFFLSLPRYDGRFRVTLDRYPPYSIYRIMQGSSWLISFAALIEAGTRMEEALEDMARFAPPWLKNRLKAILRGMRSGYSLGEALARARSGFPDEEIIDDLGVYASLSGFDSALALLGREWIDESVVSIQARMKIVFSVSIAMMGGVIAFMFSGLFAMQTQMSTAMKMAM